MNENHDNQGGYVVPPNLVTVLLDAQREGKPISVRYWIMPYRVFEVTTRWQRLRAKIMIRFYKMIGRETAW